MAAERLVTVEVSFNQPELAILAELRARLRVQTDADLIYVALWCYAHGQGLIVDPALFAVGDNVRHHKRSTRNNR